MFKAHMQNVKQMKIKICVFVLLMLFRALSIANPPLTADSLNLETHPTANFYCIKGSLTSTRRMNVKDVWDCPHEMKFENKAVVDKLFAHINANLQTKDEGKQATDYLINLIMNRDQSLSELKEENRRIIERLIELEQNRNLKK